MKTAHRTVILDYELLEDNKSFSKPMTSHKIVKKLLLGNLEKHFLKWERRVF